MKTHKVQLNWFGHSRKINDARIPKMENEWELEREDEEDGNQCLGNQTNIRL